MGTIHKIKSYKNTIKYSIANSLEIMRINMLKKDKLTGLCSKEHFLYKISNKTSGSFIMIKFIGISLINLNFGIKQGNIIITQIADELRLIDKNCEVFKLSGVEFGLYTNSVDLKYIKELIRKIQQIPSHIHKKSHEIKLSVSVSAIIYDDEYFDIFDCTNKLEIAMIDSIRKGINKYQIYNENYSKFININTIEKAIENGDITLYYQPKIDTKSGNIHGVEALVRWFDEVHGYIPPDKLIKFAEKSGYINTLGRCIIRKAYKEINDLNKLLRNKIYLSVNISPYQLEDESFLDEVIEIADDIGFDYNLLHLEITESEDIQDIYDISKKITAIKNKGIKISIDDFGKGFNSIEYIKNYDVDKIKIDKNLVQYVNNNPEFIQNLIDMVHTTNATVVAEGVEQKSEYIMLKNMGCDLIQGYYCHRPMELNNLYKVLNIKNIKLKHA